MRCRRTSSLTSTSNTPLVYVEANHVPVAYRCDRTSQRRFRRNVPRHQPAGSAAETAVGQQGHRSPSPSPTIAAVTLSIRAFPGRPLALHCGSPQHLPALICFAVTAAMASSSESNTRAGPRCSSRSCPLILATQPSGARLPLRITSPPVFSAACPAARITSCPGVSWPRSLPPRQASSRHGDRRSMCHACHRADAGQRPGCRPLIYVGRHELSGRLQIGE